MKIQTYRKQAESTEVFDFSISYPYIWRQANSMLDVSHGFVTEHNEDCVAFQIHGNGQNMVVRMNIEEARILGDILKRATKEKRNESNHFREEYSRSFYKEKIEQEDWIREYDGLSWNDNLKRHRKKQRKDAD